jgi:hypothetical protein
MLEVVAKTETEEPVVDGAVQSPCSTVVTPLASKDRIDSYEPQMTEQVPEEDADVEPGEVPRTR